MFVGPLIRPLDPLLLKLGLVQLFPIRYLLDFLGEVISLHPLHASTQLSRILGKIEASDNRRFDHVKGKSDP